MTDTANLRHTAIRTLADLVKALADEAVKVETDWDLSDMLDVASFLAPYEQADVTAALVQAMEPKARDIDAKVGDRVRLGKFLEKIVGDDAILDPGEAEARQREVVSRVKRERAKMREMEEAKGGEDTQAD